MPSDAPGPLDRIQPPAPSSSEDLVNVGASRPASSELSDSIRAAVAARKTRIPRGAKIPQKIGNPVGAQGINSAHPSTLGQRVAWGGFVSAALLLTGLISYTVWKSQLPEELPEDEVFFEQLAAAPEDTPHAVVPEVLAVEAAPLYESDIKGPAPDRSGATLVVDEVIPSGSLLVEDISEVGMRPQGKGNRQAVHFTSADESASCRVIEHVGYVPGNGVSKPAAWLAGTIEDAFENSSPSNSNDVSGPRHR